MVAATMFNMLPFSASFIVLSRSPLPRLTGFVFHIFTFRTVSDDSGLEKQKKRNIPRIAHLPGWYVLCLGACCMLAYHFATEKVRRKRRILNMKSANMTDDPSDGNFVLPPRRSDRIYFLVRACLHTSFDQRKGVAEMIWAKFAHFRRVGSRRSLEPSPGRLRG